MSHTYSISRGPLVISLCFQALMLWTRAGHGIEPRSANELSRNREPVALVFIDQGKRLIAANRRTGSLSLVDTTAGRVVAEYAIGRGLADLVTLPGKKRLLALDEAASQVLAIEVDGDRLSVSSRIDVPQFPVRAAVSRNGLFAAVASLWSRRVTIVDLGMEAAKSAPVMKIRCMLDLPFCPRELVLLGDDSKLIVADAFGGQLAVADIERRSVDSVRTLPAHNIGGMAFTPDGQSLVITHQRLNRLAQTSFDDVHWGMLIRNHRRALRTSSLLSARTDDQLLAGSRLFDIGDVTYAAGDPGRIVYTASGSWIVALGGVEEVAIGAATDQGSHRIVVGNRPSALALGADDQIVYVANRLDDTISVVEVATGRNLNTIGLGTRPELSAIERGERLFYSARLSHDNWMSCHSCHTDGHTSGQVADTLGDRSYGAPKQIPTLLGVANTGPWTWTGAIERLEDQVSQSITSTMHGTKPSNEQVADLTAYVRSLSPPRIVPAAGAGSALGASIARGREVFRRAKCASCHQPAEYTSSVSVDVGLTDEAGNRTFNPPSLRGVSLRAAFLHDGRAKALAEVFTKEKHPRGLVLEPSEITDLTAFLRTL